MNDRHDAVDDFRTDWGHHAYGAYIVSGLTERGRRAVRLSPSGESADALLDALRLAEEVTQNPRKGLCCGARPGAFGSVSRDIMVDVVAAVVTKQSRVG